MNQSNLNRHHWIAQSYGNAGSLQTTKNGSDFSGSFDGYNNQSFLAGIGLEPKPRKLKNGKFRTRQNVRDTDERIITSHDWADTEHSNDEMLTPAEIDLIDESVIQLDAVGKLN